jgi:serine O-acetyltransferase
MSPERLWLLSIALRRRGHPWLARLLKRLNAGLYHNSLPASASVGEGLSLGARSLGTVIHSNVEIGDRVSIGHGVTIAVRSGSKAPCKVIVEDDVSIGTGAVVITPHRASLRIGRGAIVGPGAVVVGDVAPGARVLSPPARTLEEAGRGGGAGQPDPGAGKRNGEGSG